MKRRVIVRPAADIDLDEARQWYERHRPGLGDEFLTMFDVLVRRIAENPLAFARLHRDVRRASMRRFPYGIFYRYLDDIVYIVAVFHGRRSPAAVKRRK
jgi:toxin ParE1/3/4